MRRPDREARLTAVESGKGKGKGKENEKGKEKEKGKEVRVRREPLSKVVLRRLPPCLTVESLLEQLQPLPEHDYFYFCPADESLSPYAYSRVYIALRHAHEVSGLRDRLDGYVFVDGKGVEFPAVLEFSPFQKVPKRRGKRDAKAGTIEDDDDYLNFLETLQTGDERPAHNPESILEELEARDREMQANRTTPLLQHLKTKMMEKQRLREERWTERRRREQEARKLRDEERRKKRAAEKRAAEKHRRHERDRGRDRERECEGDVDKVVDSGKETPVKAVLQKTGPRAGREERTSESRREGSLASGQTRPVDGEREGKTVERLEHTLDGERERHRGWERARPGEEPRRRAAGRAGTERADRPQRRERDFRRERDGWVTKGAGRRSEAPRGGGGEGHKGSGGVVDGVRVIAETQRESRPEETQVDGGAGVSGGHEGSTGSEERANRRIRNKDRPSIQLYQPGSGRRARGKDVEGGAGRGGR
uniref:regulator of nonsense transcripts 3B-like n=1 Tax=Myxine glutinosa TaxID=7769 RepID=UPI00358FA27E